ncbi:MAG: hypothetical protein KF730_02060 [Sphingomonas sp.]|uniref:hypothetical protein n=1 Tax=Sphingomonas sp. TaxID=28214 RepID=UPI0025F3F6A3|nr:hypothetical protein [Sphingomonas sp.]MBX3563338.1 hypothetical protein [Sphingomonas sp.]
MTDADLIMILKDRDQRARLALRGAGFAFVAMFATGLAVRGIADPGALFVIALAAGLLTMPVALGLGVFAIARGPVLVVFASLFAMVTVVLGALVMWDALMSSQSTAGIAFFLLPMAEMAAFTVVLTAGLVGDAILGTRGKSS